MWRRSALRRGRAGARSPAAPRRRSWRAPPSTTASNAEFFDGLLLFTAPEARLPLDGTGFHRDGERAPPPAARGLVIGRSTGRRARRCSGRRPRPASTIAGRAIESAPQVGRRGRRGPCRRGSGTGRPGRERRGRAPAVPCSAGARCMRSRGRRHRGPPAAAPTAGCRSGCWSTPASRSRSSSARLGSSESSAGRGLTGALRTIGRRRHATAGAASSTSSAGRGAVVRSAADRGATRRRPGRPMALRTMVAAVPSYPSATVSWW